MSTANLNILTRSHLAIAAKRRASRAQVKEVIFDDDARREFLTGFHKRKLAKAEAARQKAAEREKQQRKEDRREQRKMLRERAAENAAEVEQAYGAVFISPPEVSDDQEWNGISEPSQMEQEYEDEDVLATVAIVEDFDPDTLLHGPSKAVSHPELSENATEPSTLSLKRAPDDKSSNKPKPQKIRYQTKQARQFERSKQRARRTEKAERAGGKASRKKGGGRRR